MTSKENVNPNKTYALIVIAIIAGIGIFPFSVIRLFENNLLIAILDLLISISCFAIATYVHKTKKTYYPAILITLVCMGGLSVLVNTRGSTLVYWAYPIIVACYYISTPKLSMIMNIVMITTITPVLYLTLSAVEMSTILLTLLLTNVYSYIFSVKNNDQKTKLNQLAWFDGLTGAYNRRALDKRLKEDFIPDSISCLIIIDIDHFKQINDDHGHHFGDKILTSISDIIANRIRATDTLYRYGGEEFVIVTHDSSIKNCIALAEELRRLVESYPFSKNTLITISIGVAELKKGESAQDWFSRCDKALYEAKNSGRNQTSVSK